MKLRISLKISLILSGFILCACGVKGDPLPPDVPAEIGRGQPVYQSEDLDDRPVVPKAFPRKKPTKEDEGGTK